MTTGFHVTARRLVGVAVFLALLSGVRGLWNL